MRCVTGALCGQIDRHGLRGRTRAMSVVGEIRTSLVQTSAALDDEEVTALLDVLPGRFVQRVSRPVPYAASPERFVGVDCWLALPSRSVRAVGTVGHRTIVT